MGFAITRDERGDYHVGHALLHPPKEGEILAANVTAEGLARASWHVLPTDILDRDLPGLVELEDLLNTYEQRARLLRCKPETIFQRFFDDPRHAHLLYSGVCDQNYPKVALPRSTGGHYGQPDYIQRARPLSALAGRGRILDLKLPKAPLLQRRRFRRSFGRHVWDAVSQLRDYRERIDKRDPLILAALQRELGWIPEQPRMAVVVGLRQNEDPDVLRYREETLLRDLDIDLIAYDDVLNREARRIMLQYSLSGGGSL